MVFDKVAIQIRDRYGNYREDSPASVDSIKIVRKGQEDVCLYPHGDGSRVFI